MNPTPPYAPGEKVKIHVSRREQHFDRACESAYDRAVSIFGIDEAGHSDNVKDWDRSTDSIVVEFVSYRHTGGMGGHDYYYAFETWIERYDDEDDFDENGKRIK